MSEKNAVAVRWEVLPDPARSTERIAAGLLAVNRDTAEYGLVLSPDEARELGVNDSMIHEDFMIGSPDLRITGITADGREVPIFINSDWAE